MAASAAQAAAAAAAAAAALLAVDPVAPVRDPGPPTFSFSKLSAHERANVVPPGAAFLPEQPPDDEEFELPPQYELVLHHPERAGGTVPVRAGGGGSSAAAASRAAGMGVPVERAQMQVDELRQFKALCDRLLPGLRTQSHLYTLIHLCDRTHTLTLAEHGEVIGGATFRLVQAAGEPLLLLEVLLLAVEQRSGVCGRGHGTRLINYLKAMLLALAHARGGLAAALITQSDWQAGPGGGAPCGAGASRRGVSPSAIRVALWQ